MLIVPSFLLFRPAAPTLEEASPNRVASGEVSGGRKGSGPPETQLAVNVCSRIFPLPFLAYRLFGSIAQKVLCKNEIIGKRLFLCCMNGCNHSYNHTTMQPVIHAPMQPCNHTTTQPVIAMSNQKGGVGNGILPSAGQLLLLCEKSERGGHRLQFSAT